MTGDSHAKAKHYKIDRRPDLNLPKSANWEKETQTMAGDCIVPKTGYLYPRRAELTSEQMDEYFDAKARKQQYHAANRARRKNHAIEQQARESLDPRDWELDRRLVEEPDYPDMDFSALELAEQQKDRQGFDLIEYIDPKTGQRKIYNNYKQKMVFHILNERQTERHGVLNVEPEEIQVPCRKCFNCERVKAAEWALRSHLESMCHEHCIFVTLTFSQEGMWKNKDRDFGYTLNKRDVQLFMKAYRDQITKCHRERVNNGEIEPDVKPPKIKYFAAGEYGGNKGRPHYHLLIFGWIPDDCRPPKLPPLPKDMDKDSRMYDIHRDTATAKARKNLKKHKYLVSETINDCWKHQGMIKNGAVTGASAAYVTQYASKKFKQCADEALEAITLTEQGETPILINEEYIVRARDRILANHEMRTGNRPEIDPTKPYQNVKDHAKYIAEQEAGDRELVNPDQWKRELEQRIIKQIRRLETRDRAEHAEMLEEGMESIKDYETAKLIFEVDADKAVRWAKEYRHKDTGKEIIRYDIAGRKIPELTKRYAMPKLGDDNFEFDPDNEEHLMNYRTHVSIRYRRWAHQERKAFKLYSRSEIEKMARALPTRSKARKILQGLGTTDIRLIQPKRNSEGKIDYQNIETGEVYEAGDNKFNEELARCKNKHQRLLMRFKTEFHQMSLKPGIGAKFWELYKSDLIEKEETDDGVPTLHLLNDDREHIVRGIPKYFWRLLKEYNPHLYDEKREKYLEKAQAYRDTEKYQRKQLPEIKAELYKKAMEGNKRHYDDGHYGNEGVTAEDITGKTESKNDV